MLKKSGTLKGELKIVGGKFVKCLLKQHEGIIKEVHFNGDFFMHPEEKIEELEQSLKNVPLKKSEVQKIIHTVLSDTELIGVSSDDFVSLLFKTYDIAEPHN